MSGRDLPGAEDAEERGGLFADINITPLTDIFLVLLVVFMITSSVVTRRVRAGGSASVSAPSGDASPQGPQIQQAAVPKKGGQGGPPVVLQIGQRGELLLDGQQIAWKDLQSQIQLKSRLSVDQAFEIQPASGVAAGKLMDVLETAQRMGVKHISVARKKKETGSGEP